MTNNNQTTETPVENTDTNRPDYIAKQYRVIRIEDGLRTRKERIGVAWKGENDQICFRPSGAQIIEGDVYFYPFETQDEQ